MLGLGGGDPVTGELGGGGSGGAGSAKSRRRSNPLRDRLLIGTIPIGVPPPLDAEERYEVSELRPYLDQAPASQTHAKVHAQGAMGTFAEGCSPSPVDRRRHEPKRLLTGV